MPARSHAFFDRDIIAGATLASFTKLNPVTLMKNPVIFVTEVVAAVTTVILLSGSGKEPFSFGLQITLWLWFTVLFANFAEAMAEGRGKAQAMALRNTRTRTVANLLREDGSTRQVPADQLEKGQIFVVRAGEIVPADGEIIEGAATVDESAITGESAPVIREAGGDRSAITGGTRVLSDRIVARVTAERGESFLDRMIALVEGAKSRRRRTRSP
jgi:K+-transporting ATPase ATPase B chain